MVLTSKAVMPPPPLRILLTIFLGSLMPFSVSLGLMMFPPSGWQEAHLALKIASPPEVAAEAADASKAVDSISVARMIPFFIARLLCFCLISSHERIEIQRINGFGSMFG